MSPRTKTVVLVACFLLAGCPKSPDAESIKTAATSCEKSGGIFQFTDNGAIVMMKCEERKCR